MVSLVRKRASLVAVARRRYKFQDGLISWDVNAATVPPFGTSRGSSEQSTGDVDCCREGFVGSNPSFDNTPTGSHGSSSATVGVHNQRLVLPVDRMGCNDAGRLGGPVTSNDDVCTVPENGRPATRNTMSSTPSWGSLITTQSVNLAAGAAVRAGLA